jgi:hypothetical protein
MYHVAVVAMMVLFTHSVFCDNSPGPSFMCLLATAYIKALLHPTRMLSHKNSNTTTA